MSLVVLALRLALAEDAPAQYTDIPGTRGAHNAFHPGPPGDVESLSVGQRDRMVITEHMLARSEDDRVLRRSLRRRIEEEVQRPVLVVSVHQ